MTEKPPPTFSPFNKRDVTTTISIVAPVVFILALSVVAREFVINAVEANLYINLGIIGASAFGVILILRRLFAAQEDFRILERFGYEAKQGVYMKSLLEQPWLQNRYIRHYLSHIADTGGTLASQIEQTAIESELHALQTDYDSRLELPQFLVGFMIAMGLLGTFIGLLETLTGISGMLDGMGGGGQDVQKQFLKLVVELRKPLAGMGIAFSASMFGLITSLMLSIMMTNLRRYISRVISLARNVMHDLTEVVHTKSSSGSLSPMDISALLNPGSAIPDPLSEFSSPPPAALPQPSTTAIAHEADDSFVSHGKEQRNSGGYGGGLDPAMSGRFDVLTRKIESLLIAIEVNSKGNAKMVDLISYGPRMKELSEKTLEEMRSITTLTSEQHTSTQSLVTGNIELLRVISMFVESQKLANNDGAELIRRLSALATDIRDSNIGNGRHLNGIKEDFTQLAKNGEMVEMIASTMGGHTALLEVLVQEARRSQQALSAINQSILASGFKV